MGYVPVRYDSRVVIYERKIFIRLATERSRALNNRPETKIVMDIKSKFFKD